MRLHSKLTGDIIFFSNNKKIPKKSLFCIGFVSLRLLYCSQQTGTVPAPVTGYPVFGSKQQGIILLFHEVTTMKNKKILIGIIALTVVLAAAIGFYVSQPKLNETAELDNTAAARDEADEGPFHYIDETAIALAGEAESSEEALSQAIGTLDLVNSRRAAAGLGPLNWDPRLEQAAMVRAQEAAQSFSHTRPDNTEWWTVNSAIMFGENLAKGYYNADTVVQAWMDSPTHRANIESGKFSTMGVAIYQAPNGSWFWAQAFGL
jgi:uncharacterized protein YkwD